MDPNQRPHSREKTTGAGSASAGKGGRAGTGGPVGAGGRPGSAGGSRAGSTGGRPAYSSSSRGVPFKLNLKTLLIIAVLVIIGSFILKGMSGSDVDYPDIDPDPTSYDPGYKPESFPSDSELDVTVSGLARDKFYTPASGDKVTVMVYMCGTDLESKYGMATKDLQEMINADISSNVNVIVETGGCKAWQNKVVSSSANQIYKVEDEGLLLLEKNVGTAAMTDPNNLTDFINYCTSNYTAERYMLIFWDHGGGSITGYGYDEKNPSTSSMTLSKINTALKNANTKFDVIGFDACLMATLETALVCGEYGDYLLASEESEPGTGWDYKGWLTKLSKKTNISTVELGQVVIDDFIAASRSASPSAQVTLSLVDLAELEGTVPDAFRSFASSTTELIKSDSYKTVSDARAGVRQFAQSSKINQVDLVDLALRINTKDSRALAETLKDCVKYNRSSMTRCYGVSIYFPYESTSSMKSAVASYEAIGIEDEYTECIKSFASLEYAGQLTGGASQSPSFAGMSGGDLLGTLLSVMGGGSGSSSHSQSSTSPLDVLLGTFLGSGSSSSGSSSSSAGMSIDPSLIISLLGGLSGRSMPENLDWVDTELVAEHAEDIAAQYIDPSRITPTVKNGLNVLSLTDEEWSLIQTVELNVFVDDGEGYIDLGLDNVFEWNDDNDLLLDFDGTWLTLNGNVCAYYLVSDTVDEYGNWTTEGRIPALLNGQLVNLRVIFDEKNPAGTVTGAYPLDPDGTSVFPKGNIKVSAGDSIRLLCDYYNYDGSYNDSYTLGSKFTVPQSGLALRNLTLDNPDVSATFRLTDIYGNHYWIVI